MIPTKLKMEDPASSKRFLLKHIILTVMVMIRDIMYPVEITFHLNSLMEVIKYGLIIFN
jgi:hypothetical protein